MSLLYLFCDEVTKYLSRTDGNVAVLKNLIKLQERECFDFQIPASLHIWKNYLNLNENDVENYHDSILLYSIHSTNEGDSRVSIDVLKKESKKWTFTIENVEVKDNRWILLIINRPSSFSRILKEILRNPNYGKAEKLETETISIESEAGDDDTSTVTQFRVHLVNNIVKNLTTYSKFVSVDAALATHKILVTSKSNLGRNEDQTRVLLTCGAVLDPLTKKISNMSAQEYVKQRTDEMHLMSIHKYGIRVKSDEALGNLMARLGRNVATLDFLEVKTASSMFLNPDPKQSFILYNSARIETLMKKFDKKVEEGYYETISDVEIDTSLLKEEEEWKIFKLLLSFPEILEYSIKELPQGRVNIHLLHKFLTEMVSTFSVYYRRVRLLTENRAQLMPVLQAKICFLRCFQKVFNETLHIFSIEPVAFM